MSWWSRFESQIVTASGLTYGAILARALDASLASALGSKCSYTQLAQKAAPMRASLGATVQLSSSQKTTSAFLVPFNRFN